MRHALSSLSALVAVLSVLGLEPAWAGPYDRPEMTIRVLPSSPYVQQQILQTVSLISVHPFEALDVRIPDVENAQVITVAPPSVRRFLSYGIEGYAYKTVRAIFPSHSGPLELGPVVIHGAIGLRGQEDEVFERRGEAIKLMVGAAPPHFEGRQWLIANRIGLTETFSKPLHTVRVGETVDREVIMTAEGVTGEHLPALEQPSVEGIGVFSGPVSRRTRNTPDGVVGRLTQRFSVRIDTDAPVILPGIDITWWDGRARASRRSMVPAYRIEPLPKDPQALVDSALRTAAEARAASQRAIVQTAAGLSLLALVALGWLVHRSIHRRTADKRLLAELHDDALPAATLRALHRWEQSEWTDRRSGSIDRLATADTRSGRALGAYRRALYANEPTASALPGTTTLAKGLIAHARKQRRKHVIDQLKRRVRAIIGPRQRLPSID